MLKNAFCHAALVSIRRKKDNPKNLNGRVPEFNTNSTHHLPNLGSQKGCQGSHHLQKQLRL